MGGGWGGGDHPWHGRRVSRVESSRRKDLTRVWPPTPGRVGGISVSCGCSVLEHPTGAGLMARGASAALLRLQPQTVTGSPTATTRSTRTPRRSMFSAPWTSSCCAAQRSASISWASSAKRSRRHRGENIPDLAKPKAEQLASKTADGDMKPYYEDEINAHAAKVNVLSA